MTQILDYNGRPINAPARPDTREIAAVSLRDRWSEYPSRGLTPQRLAAIFMEADQGWLRYQAELFEEMEEKDTHLFSVMQTRRLAVLGLDTQIDPTDKSRQAGKIADFCREQLEALDLYDLLGQLLGAVGHGYAAAEPLWQDGAQWTIAGFNKIHPKNISFINSTVPLVITEENLLGMAPPPFKLIYHRAAARSGHDTRNGILRVCGYMYLFKNYSLKDWAAFNEIFGMPLRLGKYEPSASPADRDALKQAIMSLGTDAAGIISKSTEIEFVEAAGRQTSNANPYQVMAFFCNREMSKAVLGQTLTTDTEGSTGTYAAGKIQDMVRRDLLEADAKSLAKTIRLQILQPLVGFNYGWDQPVPEFSLIIKDSPDLKAEAEVIKLLAEVGTPIGVSYVHEHFGIPKPEEGEDILKPPVNIQPPRATDQPGATMGTGQPPAAMKLVWPLAEGALPLIPQDKAVIETQLALEELAAKAVQGSAAAGAKMVRVIKDLIASGKSLPEIRDEVLKVYPKMDVKGLAELIYQASMRAYMAARVSGEQ